MRSTMWTILIASHLFLSAGSCVADEQRTMRLTVVDADTQQALAARLYLRSADEKWLYFSTDTPNGSAVRYERQNWINKNSVEYHTTVSAHAVSVTVPAGKYQLTVEHGKSYLPQQREIEVVDRGVDIVVPLQRWNDPASRGWYSGDTHLHRTVTELKNVIVAEDLNVALPLTNWVTISDTAPASGDKNLTNVPDGLIRVDDTHVIWPRNTEYEIFTVGEHRHTLGALFVLGHRTGLERGVPPWKPVIESVKTSDPNVLFDMDKLDWPFAMLLPTLAPHALYELSNNHVWRTEFAFRNWNTKAPAYIQPPYGANEGGHRQWIDYTLGMYYTLLNCGLRMPPTAGTANGVHPVPAGFGRVYVHLPDGFEFDAWMTGLKQGRSFVTTGPMLYATADSKDAGHVFKQQSATSIALHCELTSESKLSYGELLVNGKPEVLLRPQNQQLSTGAFRSELNLSVHPQRSGWFAVRFWEPRPDGQSRFVHSAPWYVEVGGKPVQPFAHEKRYLIERVENEMRRSQGIVSAAAMQEYERALAFYQSLPAYDDSQNVQANARPATPDNVASWLDNMIVDHRFTAEEIRSATGISIQQSEVAIQARSNKKPTAGVRVLPYPGGRHPRIGFLDGAIDPQRETKVSIFPPWADGGYVVVDVPEAVFSNLGLTYLAHTHIPTIWDDNSIKLPTLEWKQNEHGLSVTRKLPNGIVFDSEVTPRDNGALMQLRLKNGTDATLTGLRVQVCTMLKGAIGFNVQEELTKVVSAPFVAVRRESTNRWIVTAWRPTNGVWTNPPVPCVHSDPMFPDCEPGETVKVKGGIWFYEGDDVKSEFERFAADL